ncbi:hypothetical protein B0H14DRAFT_2530894 [Mycena olivaceomarginata]|nr:hypothetical protein B0H14DRAFT_2530894 [Mycena olivaceomarginata]
MFWQKCDGVRPKCGQCARSLNLQDCEFADDGQVTERQRLEEKIANVESRINELTTSRTPFIPHYPYPDEHNSASRPPPSGRSSVQPLPFCHIRNFLQHSSQFGFFLNVRRFKDAAKGRSGQRPADVLLDVVHLWAIHLSGSDEFVVYEASYLSRALRTAANALSGTHSSSTVLHSIQAFILLSYYFLQNTRFLEGKYHLSAAVSLVISSGLHRIRSADSRSLSPPFRTTRMSPPRDAVEEAERINAFWAVLTLNNCLTTADGSPSNISYTDPDSRIDTPWPLDINAPGLQSQMLPNSSFGTLTAFLGNQPDNGTSASALHAKAAILFEQASRLASQYRPGTRVCSPFCDLRLMQFKFSLPTVQSHSFRLIFPRMIVNIPWRTFATIQLHNPFVREADASRSRVVTSARTIVCKSCPSSSDNLRVHRSIMGVS